MAQEEKNGANHCVGGAGVNLSLRNAINNSYAFGPRIFTAGKAIATTGVCKAISVLASSPLSMVP